MIERRKQFKVNDRVEVNSGGGWKRNCRGRICGGPEPVETMQGPEYYYWVEFDEPEEDINGPDKYQKAQILSQYINNAT